MADISMYRVQTQTRASYSAGAVCIALIILFILLPTFCKQ